MQLNVRKGKGAKCVATHFGPYVLVKITLRWEQEGRGKERGAFWRQHNFGMWILRAISGIHKPRIGMPALCRDVVWQIAERECFCLHFQVDLRVNVRGVQGDMPEPRPDDIDVHAERSKWTAHECRQCLGRTYSPFVCHSSTHLIESGVELTVVQRLMGHASLIDYGNLPACDPVQAREVRSPLDLIDTSHLRALGPARTLALANLSQSGLIWTPLSLGRGQHGYRPRRITLGAILRAFLPVLWHLLKLGKHKVRVLWHLAACGKPALGANLFACPHCPHRHWAPRSCGDRHCPRCLAAKSWQWLQKQTRSLLPIPYYHCVFTRP